MSRKKSGGTPPDPQMLSEDVEVVIDELDEEDAFSDDPSDRRLFVAGAGALYGDDDSCLAGYVVYQDGRQALKEIDVESVLTAPYDLLEGILKERSENVVSALASNIKRHGLTGRLPDVAAGASAVATGVLAGSPVMGVIVGGALSVARTLFDLYRIRKPSKRDLTLERRSRTVIEARRLMLHLAARLTDAGRDAAFESAPDLAEFRNSWIRSAWRLVHLINGYNLRVGAVNAVMADPLSVREEIVAARGMARLLVSQRVRLLRIKRTLEELSAKEGGSFARLAKRNQHVEDLDLFGDRSAGEPFLDWLLLPSGILLKAELRRQYADDLMAIDCDRESTIMEIDRKFAALEDEDP